MNPRVILVCTDFSTPAAAGEREAAKLFPDATLVLFHATEQALIQRVVDATGLDGDQLRAKMEGYADQRLKEVVDRLKAQGIEAIADIAFGDGIEEALAAVKRHKASLIVISVAPAEPGRFRTALVRRARVPVLVIPGDQ